MEFNVQFPNPRNADSDGLVAVGGELSAEYLIAAYAQGVFPWFNEGDPILWWSPDPRMVLDPNEFKVSKSLKQTVNSGKFEVKIDSCFERVIENCGKIKREGQEGSWITDEMKDAYMNLHEMGIAHSFETFHADKLVGGLYGVSIGAAFFGESMFFEEANASKVAFYNLVEWAKKYSFHFIDAQQSTQHLRSMGAKDVTRDNFLEKLNEALLQKTLQGNWGDSAPFI